MRSMLIEHKQDCLKWRPPSNSPVCLYFLRERPSIYGQPENTNNPPPPVKNRPLLSQSFLRCLCVRLLGLLIACLLLQRLCSGQQGPSQPPSALHLKHKIEINWKCCLEFLKPPPLPLVPPWPLTSFCVCSATKVLIVAEFARIRTQQGVLLLDDVTSLAPSITTSWP